VLVVLYNNIDDVDMKVVRAHEVLHISYT